MALCLPPPSVCLLVSLLTTLALWEADSWDVTSDTGIQRVSERELLLELQDVLDKLQSKRSSMWEIKYNQMPRCIMGDSCAVKRGHRIGKLCDCPGRSNCNYFFLKCL